MDGRLISEDLPLTHTESPTGATREREWFALKVGPPRLRTFVNMLFLPYTLMNTSYVLIGSLVSPAIHWDRAAGLYVVYFLAVGFSAHALDATGKNRPWGGLFSKSQLWEIALASLLPALALGGYLAVSFAPWLLAVGALEIFFLFAYNLNLFHSSFHSVWWFALSWGFLPAIAGFVGQTDTVAPVALAAGLFGFATAYLEAKASRPYKALKAEASPSHRVIRLERILKADVGFVLVVALALAFARAFG